MTTRTFRDLGGNPLTFYEDVHFEHTVPLYPCQFYEDFVGAVATVPAAGAAVAGYHWVKKLQQTAGAPSVARVASQPGGVIAMALDSTSEKQEATLYFGDELNLDVTKGLVFDARAAMSVVPSAAAVEMVWGLMSTWIDGPNNNTCYVRFQASGSGAVNVQSFDGTNTYSNATGVTLSAGSFSQFRIDMSDPTNIGFFINGTKVSPVVPATLMNFSATDISTPTSILQPYFGVYKTSGTGVGTLQLDAVRAFQTR